MSHPTPTPRRVASADGMVHDPMQYDDLIKGRRRDWEKLKPPEQRKAEARERREAALQAAEKAAQDRANSPRMPGDTSENEPVVRKGYFERRRERLEKAREADLHQFGKARRMAYGALAFLVVLFLGSWTVRAIARFNAKGEYQQELEKLESLASAGHRLELFKSPTGALLSWRSAWIRKDAWAVWRTLSAKVQQDLSRAKNVNLAVGETQARMKSGALDGYIESIRLFEKPEIVRLPLPPYRNGELAIFRSPPIQRTGSKFPPQKWIIAVAYSTELKEWRFAEFREAEYFSVKWTVEPMIMPKMGGVRAIRYDEDGHPLDPRPTYSNTTAPGAPKNP